jgi:methionyl-tRNA synthetase
MIGKYCGGVLPEPGAGAFETGPAAALFAQAVEAGRAVQESSLNFTLNAGIAQVMEVVRATNRFIEVQQPWAQARAADPGPLHTTLYAAAEALRVCAGLLMPVMPERMTVLRAALGMEAPASVTPDEWTTPNGLKPGVPVSSSGALFPRIEAPAPAAEARPEAKAPEKGKATGTSCGADPLPEGVITYEDFSKVKLRTAKILAAEPIEGAVKLLKLNVLMGEERRQIVAGIALYYTPEKLIGKTVVVVANLAPIKLRGVESQGMLLAASKGERLLLVTVDGDLSSGAVVK